ncbi:MAG: ABC transporter ATP-binding protein [Desulfobacterales bacterium]|nr:ABC transporter ATP-binding protein [Desulfobacterales bacterium]
MLSVENVSAGYGGILAIQNISMNVQHGEIVVLIGANGAGKSTLLRAISGALKPKEGQIVYQDRKIDGFKPYAIVKMGLVQIPEGRGILSRMTVKENLEMGAYLRSDKNGIAKDLEQVFEKFPRLKERLDQNAGTLSGGEQQMLAIGRALMAKPQLLLMDEPSLGLAPVLVEFIIETIHELRAKDGYTILLVEQNANQALTVADRGYVMETGRIVLEGDSRALRDNKEVQKAYLGKAGRSARAQQA